jgi:transcription initiation factor IIE alpha subunit
MSKWTCEVVRDFDRTYYANMYVDGNMVKDLPEYVDYKTLKEAIKQKTGIEILKCKDMIFEKYGRKYYAFIDATQTRKDCRVTFEEKFNGIYRPDFS